MIGGSELLGPAEVILAPGRQLHHPGPVRRVLRTAAWTASARCSTAGSGPARTTCFPPRAPVCRPASLVPSVLNTWEAVYFDHNLATLIELADSAAELGVERFVLDDGWFRGRRDDHAGLGDWYVDETLWPDGLTP